MMKLLCSIFGCPNLKDELVNQVRHIEEAIKEDANRLAKRKKELIELKIALGIPTGNKASLAVQVASWGAFGLFLTLVCITVVLIGTVDREDIADFLAYAFPTLAAVVAGLGLVLGHDRRYYCIACVSVVAGLVSYTVSKYQPSLLSYLLIVVVYGLSILVGAKLVSIAHEKTEKSERANTVKKWVYAGLLLLSLADFAYVVWHRKELLHIQPKITNMTCEVTDITDTGQHHAGLKLSCQTIPKSEQHEDGR